MHVTEVLDYVRNYFTANGLVDIELTDDQLYNIAIKPTLAILDRYIPCIKMMTIENVTAIGMYTYQFNEDVVGIVAVVPEVYTYGLTTVQHIPVLLSFNTLLSIYHNIVNNQHYRYLSWRFIPPRTLTIHNMVIISDNVGIIYYTRHADDLTTVDDAFRWTTFKLALANAKRSLGTARKKYSSYDTPFGQIMIDLDIRQEGEDEIKQIEEELKNMALPIPFMIG